MKSKKATDYIKKWNGRLVTGQNITQGDIERYVKDKAINAVEIAETEAKERAIFILSELLSDELKNKVLASKIDCIVETFSQRLSDEN